MIIELQISRRITKENKKLDQAYQKMQILINALNNIEFPEDNKIFIQKDIEIINSFSGTDKELIKLLRKTYKTIVVYIEKEQELVLKHHYQNTWMAYGILAGVLLSSLFQAISFTATWNSMGFLLLMGMLAGMLVGKNRDKKAAEKGKQLDI